MIESKFEGVEKVTTILRGVKPKLEKSLLRFAHHIATIAKTYVPVDTGRLRASIFAKQESPTSASVGTNVKYAMYVEFGHKAIILPVKAKALRFYIRGEGWVFSKKVVQGRSGKSANWVKDGDKIKKPFLIPALQESLKRLNSFFEGVFEK